VNLLIGYQSTYKILAVASRDVYQYAFMDIDKDGTLKIILWEVPDKPATKGKVRMILPLAGVFFKPLKDDPRGKCQISFYLEASLGGSIPAWVQTKAIGMSTAG
jgi:hypothetical protein